MSRYFDIFFHKKKSSTAGIAGWKRPTYKAFSPKRQICPAQLLRGARPISVQEINHIGGICHIDQSIRIGIS